ncbi:UNVERIFIED_CONTAM: hypothetical protein HDU68_006044 [Siphonaria sp. JEL0065]|nr:hypothetical protein HDU68_006044 [Siphonaria sp. JEL0065]
MFAKKKKAKKSISALVLASAAAGTIAFPSLVNTLSTLRLATATGPFTGTQQQQQTSFQAAKTRAQSLGEAQFHTQNTSSTTLYDSSPNPTLKRQPTPKQPPHQHLPSPPLREKKSVNFNPVTATTTTAPTTAGLSPSSSGETEDWDLEFSTGVIQTHRAPTLPPFPRTPKPLLSARANIPLQRRVVSAPSFAQARFNPHDCGGGSIVTNTQNQVAGGVVDALWEDAGDDEFLVASVKQKVVSRREKELERSVSANGGLESWDDDFFVDGEEEERPVVAAATSNCGGGRVMAGGMSGLTVPEFVHNVQETLRLDAENLRKFSLHIEDLKLIYMDALDISFGLDFECPEKVSPLTQQYQKTLDIAQVLINLGDFNDHNEKMQSDDLHLSILGELLGEVIGNPGDLKALAMASLKMQFSCEYMQVLIKSIGPVKKNLNKYVTELRKELERRLNGRGTESAESLAARLNAAKAELAWGLGQNNGIDHVVVNDDVEIAYNKLKKVLIG